MPVFVACGGDEIEGVDYFMAKKVLRKFEQLNISYIRDEITPYIDFLDKTFGKGKMKECIDYMMRLKKTYLINFGGKEYGRFKILDICQGATGKRRISIQKI